VPKIEAQANDNSAKRGCGVKNLGPASGSPRQGNPVGKEVMKEKGGVTPVHGGQCSDRISERGGEKEHQNHLRYKDPSKRRPGGRGGGGWAILVKK